MKAQFLKLAGIKSEKEFYARFPDEKSFMAKYGKQLKKAQGGWWGDAIPQTDPNAPSSDYSQRQTGTSSGGYMRQPELMSTMQNSAQRGGPSTVDLLPSQQPTLAPWSPPVPKQSPDLSQMGGPASKIAKGIISFIDEQKQKNKAKQWEDVSDVQLQASRTKDIDTNRQLANNMTKKRQMMMPVNTGEEFFPIYGVGTNALAKSGKKIKGQIANTYAPKTLYDDLGLPKAVDGWDQMAGMTFGNNAGSQVGSGVGDAASEAANFIPGVGPLVSKGIKDYVQPMLTLGLGAADEFFGPAGKIKAAKEKTAKNIGMMGMQGMGQGIQQQNTSFMRDGGWTPQVINSFGEHTMRDLLRPDIMMNILRAGGHLQEYTPPSERAMQTFDMGGDLKTHWGGYAEPISDNPYSQSPTVMFRGQSHDESEGKGRSGIGMTYGNSPVEVERGEPAQEFADGGKEKSLVVFGNLPISNTILPLLGDPTAKGKKFKNYINDLSKKEAIQNKTIDKATKQLADLVPRTPYEKLTMASLTANMKGADQNLQALAQKKQTAAALQQAINDTAEEHGLVADDLSKGNIKYAKLGTTLYKAVDGYKSKYGIEPWQGNIAKGDKYGKQTGSDFTTQQWDEVADRFGFKGKGNKEFQEFLLKDPEAKSIINQRHQNLYGKDAWVDPKHFGAGWAAPELKQASLPEYAEQMILPEDNDLSGFSPVEVANKPVENTLAANKKFPWQQAFNEVLPYLRPSDAEDLDPRQLSGEMFALSNNQQEPVSLQTFQPQLTTPYDISYQDKLNENQATFRSAQRTMGYNPAAQANLAAQQYQANEGVLGEQFRANQAMKNQTYAQNRESLNQAQLRNLQAYDQQATRQSQAKSNTKEVTQAALSSISDKFLKNQLSNRNLQTYENMYNYRYGPKMVAENMNPLAQFDTSGAMAIAQSSQAPAGYEATNYTKNPDGTFEPSSYKKIKTKTTSRNGSIVSSFKNL